MIQYKITQLAKETWVLSSARGAFGKWETICSCRSFAGAREAMNQMVEHDNWTPPPPRYFDAYGKEYT